MSAFAKLLLCPETTYEDSTKHAIFTDCSAPRNLQPTCHFRKVYPGGDNFGKDSDTSSDNGSGSDSFVPPKDTDKTPPLPGSPMHESTRIGDLDDSSSLNLQISDDTLASDAKWKKPSFRQRVPRSRKSSWRENSDIGTPSSSTASSRRPSRSTSNSSRKRQRPNRDQSSFIPRECFFDRKSKIEVRWIILIFIIRW